MRLVGIAAIILVCDQVTKVMVRQTMDLYQSVSILGDWLKLTFTKNPGMAFGITFGPEGLITGFSIIATMLIVVYAYSVRKGYWPYQVCLSAVLAGAIGNIIDRLFYGVIFEDGMFFKGSVVDFIHVNVWSGFVPEALPLIGGTYLSLFPIFNIADIAIVGGVVGILVFQKKFHEQTMESEGGLSEAAPDSDLDVDTTPPGNFPETL